MKPLNRDDKHTRAPGQHFVKGAPFAFRERLEAVWAKEPNLSVLEAARRTGASRSVAFTVARRLRAAGKLPLATHGGTRGLS